MLSTIFASIFPFTSLAKRGVVVSLSVCFHIVLFDGNGYFILLTIFGLNVSGQQKARNFLFG